MKALKIEAPAAASEFGKTFPLTAAKREIKSRGFDPAEVRAFVDANYRPEKFAALLEPHRGNIVLLEAPSTSGNNIIPLELANRLAADFEGIVLRGNQAFLPLAKKEAKGKNSYIEKMEDPSRFKITDPDLREKLEGKFLWTGGLRRWHPLVSKLTELPRSVRCTEPSPSFLINLNPSPASWATCSRNPLSAFWRICAWRTVIPEVT